MNETDTRGMLSPFANVYPPLTSTYQYPSAVASGPYGFPGYGQHSGMPMYQMPQMFLQSHYLYHTFAIFIPIG